MLTKSLKEVQLNEYV